VWFAEASDVGLGIELELAAVAVAVRQIETLPDGLFMSMNVSPEAVSSPLLAALLRRVPGGRIVIELTEHARVDDYEALDEVLAPLRSRGVRLAVDDAGAGFATLQHILRLQPDLIKLDLSLTRDIDKDPVRRALASSLVSFAREINAQLIAEGVETAEELETIRALGIAFGQGYHLARPQPLPLRNVRVDPDGGGLSGGRLTEPQPLSRSL
jgi:EAL domain-containing protein (putative c-di-GMP-specific phosphodiesterase class I)